mmetsp:Transcript_53233/g.126672  ORF Transcript_53233/g.126672 Transcript_53233/m.126672 type:complete len:84 (+) Transcript_53233:3418-3669(+)
MFLHLKIRELTRRPVVTQRLIHLGTLFGHSDRLCDKKNQASMVIQCFDKTPEVGDEEPPFLEDLSRPDVTKENWRMVRKGRKS